MDLGTEIVTFPFSTVATTEFASNENGNCHFSLLNNYNNNNVNYNKLMIFYFKNNNNNNMLINIGKFRRM